MRERNECRREILRGMPAIEMHIECIFGQWKEGAYVAYAAAAASTEVYTTLVRRSFLSFFLFLYEPDVIFFFSFSSIEKATTTTTTANICLRLFYNLASRAKIDEF